MSLPLEDIRVLDFSNLLTGPFCTLMLAELGADVIKVEHPTSGDPTRSVKCFFNSINRNKKSITMNLKDKESVSQIKKYLKNCDVIVEGFRPGTMKKFGLEYEDVKEINEKIIYCSISNYGQTGPMVRETGHDINFLALSGVLSLSGNPDGPPEATGGVPISDQASSMYSVISILAALRNREKTGKGDYIDVSIADSTLAWMTPRIGQYYDKGKPTKKEFLGRGAYGTFQTKNGQFIALGSLENHLFEGTCQAIGKPELINNEKYSSRNSRSKYATELNGMIQQEIEKRTTKEWLKIFDEYQVPCTKVMNIDELTQVELFKERNLIKYFEADNKHEDEYAIKFPVQFQNSHVNSIKKAPKLGEYNEKFFKQIKE